MDTEHILKQIYKDLMEQIKKNPNNIFIKTYIIPSKNYNIDKEDVWFASGIQSSIKYMLKNFDNRVYYTSYKDEYFFSNNKEKAQEKMLKEVDKDKTIKKNKSKKLER